MKYKFFWFVSLFLVRILFAKDDSQSMIEAIKVGNLRTVQKLLASGVSANAYDQNGVSALSWAVFEGDTKVARTLLNYRADPNALNSDGITALMRAAQFNEKTSLVELLVEYGADLNIKNKKGWTALFFAIATRHDKIAKFLLAKGADIKVENGKDELSALALARKYQRKEIIQLLETAAITSSIAPPSIPQTTVIEETPTHLPTDVTTITDNRPTDTGVTSTAKQIKTLPSDGSKDVNATDQLGRTWLIRAAMEGNGEDTQLLLGKSANVEIKDNNGWTALMHASFHGHKGIVRALLDHGADVNAKAKTNSTPLIVAAAEGRTEIVELLLARRAYPNAKDSEGKDALAYATQKGYVTTIAALKRAQSLN